MKQLADKILAAFCRSDYYNDIQGDLDELYHRRIKTIGRRQANQKHLAAVIMLIRPNLIRSFRRNSKTQNIMLGQFLKYANRNFQKHLSYSLINVFGLSIGVAAAILLYSYISFERSYDRYYEDADRIYRISTHFKIQDRERNGYTGSGLLAPTLMEEIPEVELAGRRHYMGRVLIVKESAKFQEHTYYADPEFVQILEYEFLIGDPKTALAEPNTLILSRSTAMKIFETVEAIGQQLLIDDQLMQVTGVFENVPNNTHFRPEVLVSTSSMDSFSWDRVGHVTYVKIQEGIDPSEIDQKLSEVVEKYELSNAEDEFFLDFSLFPVTEIHLSPDPDMGGGGNAAMLNTLTAVAIFLILIASINYMNMATAQSGHRAKEIGVRKVIGAAKKQIRRQFLVEAIFISVISSAVGVGLSIVFKSEFVSLTGFPESQPVLSAELIVGLLVFSILLGLLSGSYPAFSLSNFKPILVLRGLVRVKQGKNLRRFLVFFQFVISISLVVGTLVVRDQLDYIRTKDLGYNREGVYIVSLRDGDENQVLKSKLLRHPNIKAIAKTNLIPAWGDSGATFEITNEQGETSNDIVSMATIDDDYLSLLDMEIIQGEGFNADNGTNENTIVINEEMVRKYGWKEPIGQSIALNIRERETFKIVGVVKDFNMLSLHTEIKPFAFFKAPKFNWGRKYLLLKLSTSDLTNTIAYIQETYEGHDQKAIFNGWFMDEQLERAYQDEVRMSEIFMVFSGLTIIIACLGLFGLAAFTVERRMKEINIRKVLGADPTHILKILMTEFLVVVMVAGIVAIPIIYKLMAAWLDNFQYHTDIRIFTLLLGILLTMLIAGFTVSFQAWRAIKTNPAEKLMDE